VNSTPLRLLAYARVSDVRGRQGPGFISEADQLERCRAYAKAYGHKIIDSGSDLDVSGGVMSRPTFDTLLERVRLGKADGIIVAKLDRFARSSAGALEAVTAIEDAGGVLVSVAEQIDSTTAAGRFLRSILFAAAEWERERIADNWLAARTQAVERGIHVSRHPPLGYVRAPRSKDPAIDRRLMLDPVHADDVRQAFKMAADGANNATIAAYLTQQGVGNGRFLSHRVPRLLANRVYLGEARSGNGIANGGAHDALVDERTFLLARRERNSGPTSGGRAVAALAGIVRCAGCRHSMKSQKATGTSSAVYRCPKHSVHGECPSPSTVTRLRVESHVIDAFVAWYSDLAFSGSANDGDDGVSRALEAERAYRAELDNVALRNTIGAADHDRLIAALHRDWQAALAEATPKPRPVAMPEGVALAELVDVLVADGDDDGLRELLGSGIQAVFVRPAASRARNLPIADRIHIVWADDDSVDVPRRGLSFEPRPFDW
jgi:DNA invertase Pin-like site-specific DNA recombinase